MRAAHSSLMASVQIRPQASCMLSKIRYSIRTLAPFAARPSQGGHAWRRGWVRYLPCCTPTRRSAGAAPQQRSKGQGLGVSKSEEKAGSYKQRESDMLNGSEAYRVGVGHARHQGAQHLAAGNLHVRVLSMGGHGCKHGRVQVGRDRSCASMSGTSGDSRENRLVLQYRNNKTEETSNCAICAPDMS